MDFTILKILILAFLHLFETGSRCIALAILELTM